MASPTASSDDRANPYFSTLLAIASYTGPIMRVMAEPGTGKTFAMLRKVARLLETGTHPTQILAVTFTRTAASDLVTQLRGLGAADAALVDACTPPLAGFPLVEPKRCV